MKESNYTVKFIALAILMIVAPAAANSSTHQVVSQTQSCFNRARLQGELHICADHELGRTGRAMDRLYREVLKRAARTPGAVAKIRVAQRSWVAYRTAYMDAMFPLAQKQYAYGTMYPTLAEQVRNDLTQRQVNALTELLIQYSGGLACGKLTGC